jgi:hypothetical protein
VPRYSIDWTCKACGLEQALVVRVASAGAPDDDDDIENAAGRQNAAFFREASERNAVHMKLTRRPCPKCGAIDRRKLVLGGLRSFLLATFVAALTGLIEVVRQDVPIPLEWVLVGAPVMGLAWTAYQVTVRWKPTRLDVAVEA